MKTLFFIFCIGLLAYTEGRRWPDPPQNGGHLDLHCHGHQNSTNRTVPICRYPSGVNETGFPCNHTSGWEPTVWLCSSDWWEKFFHRTTTQPPTSSTSPATTFTVQTTPRTANGLTSPATTKGHSTSPVASRLVRTTSTSASPTGPSPTTEFELELFPETSPTPQDPLELKTLTQTTLKETVETTTSPRVFHTEHTMCWLLVFMLLFILFLIFIYWLLYKIRERKRRRNEFSVLYTRNPPGCHEDNIYESIY